MCYCRFTLLPPLNFWNSDLWWHSMLLRLLSLYGHCSLFWSFTCSIRGLVLVCSLYIDLVGGTSYFHKFAKDDTVMRSDLPVQIIRGKQMKQPLVHFDCSLSHYLFGVLFLVYASLFHGSVWLFWKMNAEVNMYEFDIPLKYSGTALMLGGYFSFGRYKPCNLVWNCFYWYGKKCYPDRYLCWSMAKGGRLEFVVLVIRKLSLLPIIQFLDPCKQKFIFLEWLIWSRQWNSMKTIGWCIQ